MRFEGRLEKWNDDRGFGFIAPTRGGEPVFVHVSAFPRDGRRPQPGEVLTFEVEPARDGRKQATNVQRPGSQASVRTASVRSREMQADRLARPAAPRRPARSSRLGLAAVGVAMLAAAGYASTQWREGRVPFAAPPAMSRPAPVDTPARFRCDGRTFCSQMTSCDEAKFFLRNCPGTKMDGDGDGIPCERQWCSR